MISLELLQKESSDCDEIYDNSYNFIINVGLVALKKISCRESYFSILCVGLSSIPQVGVLFLYHKIQKKRGKNNEKNSVF